MPRKTTRQIRETGEVDALHLIANDIRRRHPDLPYSTPIEIRVHIPSGGDYSGQALDLSEVTVTYAVEWTEGEEDE